jgi:hypothetical protein
MPRGSKRHTSKQRRQASHIEESERKTGRSPKRAKQIAYATVNKQASGGKTGGGRGKTRGMSSSSRGGRKGGRKTSSK